MEPHHIRAIAQEVSEKANTYATASVRIMSVAIPILRKK